MSLLHYVRTFEYDDSNIETALGVIKVIYDAHPEAIENHEVASNIHLYHQQVQTFLNGELVYSRQAKDHSLMTKPDDNGQLPLHIALQNNVRLGSIKLLMKGNPSALRALDHNFALPLHVACQHHESASVVQYLLSLSEITLDAVDREGNTALHYACRGAKYDTIALFCWRNTVLYRYRNGMLTKSFLSTFCAKPMRSWIEKASSTRRASFVF